MNFPDFTHLEMPDGAQAELNRAAQELSMKLAGALDLAIRTFVNALEGREVPNHEIMHGARVIKLATHSHEEPNEWENFFIWRGNVMAYRTITGSHVNESNHAASFEATLQTLCLPRDQWPEPLVKFMEENP